MDLSGTITLKPEDVPGAVLPEGKPVEDCTLFQLRRWIECRGLKKLGNKPELIERVNNCINAGRESAIFVGVDGGKWYDAKRNLSVGGASSKLPDHIIPSLKWGRFPSQSIPKYFNKGHIYTYIAGPQVESDDYEVVDPEGGITEKPFRRGSQFVSSDHIHEVYDARNNIHYYLKAKCLASFRANVSYDVKCILNQMSGAVLSEECTCKQSALGKCSHISALLLFLSKFVEELGSDALACTSKLREWGLGAKQKTPGAVSSHVYLMLRFHPLLRAAFDPRPTTFTRDVNLNNFIADIQCGKTFTMFETRLKYEDFQMDDEDIQIVKQQIINFKENMEQYMRSHETKVFAIEGAQIQNSAEWKRWRTYFITASNTKTASSLSTISAKSNFIKKNLWLLTPTYTLSSLEYEPAARHQYKMEKLEIGES